MGASILLADDHSLVRQALRRVIETMGDLAVVGEASTGLEAVGLATRLRPTIAVVDIALPLLCGIEATRQIAESHGGTRILVLTMHHDQRYVQLALDAGADAYVVKSAGLDEFREAIDALVAGGSYISPHLLDRRGAEAAGAGPTLAPICLTRREREIVGLLGEGLSAREVAHRLAISCKTVEAHRGNAMAKLGLHKTTALVRFAIREGLVSE